MEQTICIFGDSITWGAFDPENGGWVAQLRRYFETNDDYDIAVYNQGISGENTDDLLARFKVECAAREPQIIIFAIGINDSQYIKTKDNPRVSLEKFQNNLVELINQAKNFSNKIAFIGLTKVEDEKLMPIPWSTEEKYYDNDNVERYNAIIEKVSSEHNLPFLNLLDLLEFSDLNDGLHPNSNGHKKMFLEIKEFLQTKKLVQ
ncbi:MAG: SGNH/GDSL hydrolase family protein [Parcubacteria group bacterium]